LRIEVHGKNLFYFFGKKGNKNVVVVHIHFGMAGAFAVYKANEPETTPNTRLRLKASPERAGKAVLTAHLSAITVKHGSLTSLYDSIAQKLGPDPLREDADPGRFFSACMGLTSKKSIGAVLMDQSVIAGVGNIYRSETLYEAGIHPEQPANTLSESELKRLWNIIVKQMQDGFKTGSIWGRRCGPRCYDRGKSACGGKVMQWVMGGRNVYACSKKQRFDKSRKPLARTPKLSLVGTKHIGRVVSAVVAEGKKRRSGEGLAVQHVALKDDRTLAAAQAARAALKKRRLHP
jgi:formamidopyrimidine-DNA glycosylase